MPRPQRCRRICSYPEFWSFGPLDAEGAAEEIWMTLDELEAVRLIDGCGMTQEQCASGMGVARTTVTSIYDSARKKLARMLTQGATLRVGGGSYRLGEQGARDISEKGENTMRAAVSYENGEIFQHFGRTEQFKIYDIEDGKVTSSQTVGTNGTGHGALAGFLKEAGVDCLICGGIGQGARAALAEAGIELYPGVSGSADEAAAALAAGTLEFDADTVCDHHGEGHGEGHECGEHGCGHHEGHGCGHHE